MNALLAGPGFVAYALLPLLVTPPEHPPDYVAGKLIRLNDNGAWS